MTAREGTTEHDHLGNLGRRALVTIVGAPVVALAIASGPRVSAALFAAAAGTACWEYERLTLGRGSPAAWLGIGVAALMPLLPAFVSEGLLGASLFGVTLAASLATWLVHLFGAHRATAPERIGHTLAGLLFCAGGMVALSALRVGDDGRAWTAIVVVGTWSNDAAAYLVGRALGRRKLWPAVSPGKTWEGLVAGLGGGVLALVAIRPWLPRYLDVSSCVALGLVIGVAAPLGDLCKSMLKRAYHVKDMSHLLPGHGGVLDRIDGILFAAPCVWLVRATLVGP